MKSWVKMVCDDLPAVGAQTFIVNLDIDTLTAGDCE